MSRMWAAAEPGSRHICRHPRCRLLDLAAGLTLTSAYAALALLVTATGPVPALTWLITGITAMAISTILQHWPHPRAGDPGIEAIADATRESRFISHRPHFEQWKNDIRRGRQ